MGDTGLIWTVISMLLVVLLDFMFLLYLFYKEEVGTGYPVLYGLEGWRAPLLYVYGKRYWYLCVVWVGRVAGALL